MSSNSTMVWDRKNGDLLYESDEIVGETAFHPAGDTALTIITFYGTFDDGTQKAFPSARPVRWHLKTGDIIAEGETIDRRGVTVYGPAGNQLFYVIGDALLDVHVLRLDRETFETLDDVAVPNSMTGEVYEAAVTPDGSQLIVGRIGGYRSPNE